MNKNTFDLLNNYLPYGLLYKFEPKSELLNGDLTEIQLIKNINLIEKFNQISFINSIKDLNKNDFIEAIEKHYLYFKDLHKNEPYLNNYWLSKTNYLILNSTIEPNLKEAFREYFHEKHFPEKDNLKNWKDVKYYYDYYLRNIDLNINSVDYVNKISAKFFDSEIFDICHRAKVEIEKGVINKCIDTNIIKHDLKLLDKRHFEFIEKHNLNHTDKMHVYNAYFETMQYLYDNLFNWFNSISQFETEPLQSNRENKSIESKEPKNKYPKIFKNGYAYEMFIELKNLTVDKNPLADYGFIYYKLIDKKIGAINNNITHPIFIDFLRKEFDVDIVAKKFTFKDQKNKQQTYKTILEKYKTNIID